MDTIIPITKAKNILLDLVRRAKEEGEVFTLTKRGEPEGVVMSYDEYESLMETLDLLSDKKMTAKIRKGLREIDSGELIAHEDLLDAKV